MHLDPTTCGVTYKGQPIHLTPKEYSLLRLFLHNGSRLFSYSTIINQLWTSSEDPPGEETVRSHIKGLRRKLKLVGVTTDLIETVHGLGYHLKPLPCKAKSQTEAITKPLVSQQDESGQALEQLLYLARCHGYSLYLALLELDNIEQISRQYSDTAASMVRQQVEQLLRCRFRRIDVVACRYDGVYSIGMCETTKGNGAKRLAEILDVLHQKEFDGPNGTQIRLALRVSTASYPEDGANLQTLYHVANTAQRLHL